MKYIEEFLDRRTWQSIVFFVVPFLIQLLTRFFILNGCSRTCFYLNLIEALFPFSSVVATVEISPRPSHGQNVNNRFLEIQIIDVGNEILKIWEILATHFQLVQMYRVHNIEESIEHIPVNNRMR